MFASLPTANQVAAQSEGILRPLGGEGMRLGFAADRVDASGKAEEAGWYEIGEDLRLRRVNDAAAERSLRETWAPKQDFEVDAASVVMKDKRGQRFRLPKGAEVFSTPSPAGWRRGIREVVTERRMMNIHGTFYELPHDDSGGLAKIRPITTHNRRIFDFASWRGMLVLSGNLDDQPAAGHTIKSDDGKAALWLGNLEDLWKLGPPQGEGGPWRDSPVKPSDPSAPYLMTGYDHKSLRLSHDRPEPVRFTLEVDILGDGKWNAYQSIAVPAGQTILHTFPEGFSAHWIRIKASAECKATAWFRYNLP